jgi:putative oxidoreductase
MSLKNITHIARVLFAIPFFGFGLMHLTNGQEMAGMVPSYLPGAIIWVYLTGIAKIGVAGSIVANKWTGVTGLMLAFMLLIFVFTVHLPLAISGVQSKVIVAMPNLLKDMGLAGGALLVAGLGREAEA